LNGLPSAPAAGPAPPFGQRQGEAVPASRTLILGMGNPILTDDSIGCRLAAAVKAALGGTLDAGPSGPARTDVIEECSVGGLNLLDVIAGYDRVVVLDSVRTRGGVPGDLYRFTAADLRPTQHLSNVHDANFATALELGRRMGMSLPADERIHVLAVEIVDNETFGEALSEPLARQFDELVSRVVDVVRELLEGERS
jgi:hydrogenase maturation protease